MGSGMVYEEMRLMGIIGWCSLRAVVVPLCMYVNDTISGRRVRGSQSWTPPIPDCKAPLLLLHSSLVLEISF